MKKLERALALLVSGWLLAPAVQAVNVETAAPDHSASTERPASLDRTASPDRNYQVFVERNPFGLKPIPPPPTNVVVAPPPKDEVLLTGITSLGGLRAYFMSKAPQGKAPEYYSLGPDEKKNGLEVLQIDIQAKSVKVRNSGIENILTFASNGVKAPAAASAPPTPGMPQVPGAVPLPGGGGVPNPGGMANPGGGYNPNVPGGTTPANAAGPGRVRTIPSRNARTPSFGANPAGDPNYPAAPAQRPDPNAGVQDVLMMELQKRANPNVVFPPTPMPPQ